MDRRDVLYSLGGLAAARAFGIGADVRAAAASMDPPAAIAPAGAPFPRKADFTIEPGYTYLNAAYTHPIPKASVAAAREAALARGTMRTAPKTGMRPLTPRELFAQLINAKPGEIAHVSSTSEGENLVVQALGLHRDFSGNVVTDGLHFEGSIMHLLELRKKGLDVRVVAPTKDARIDMRDLERAVDRKTRLIEVSAAAMYNGFQHDLKAVADLAHAHGAYVYADIVHAAGAGPFDVKASGIDFASCSSFKWLMGDFGLGFLYAREEVLDRIERPVVGYYQADDIDANYPPNLPGGEYTPVTYTFDRTAKGMFETGSLTGSVEVNVALLRASLDYVLSLGVANIQAYRQPLIKRLQQEMPRLGFTAVTPSEATGGNVTFARTNVGASDVPNKLAAAKVNVRVATHWLRVSPSVYNDMRDIERLLEALS
ncbi:MAG: aminotransferase class V-fold PLP-dependent enzyme [Gemmatimonadetes bacterium]|nr:aminotransferase class V-fold PLP-dependent enzyme [Gemmatimonadota bacterium]